jgi:hypothetical protein
VAETLDQRDVRNRGTIEDAVEDNYCLDTLRQQRDWKARAKGDRCAWRADGGWYPLGFWQTEIIGYRPSYTGAGKVNVEILGIPFEDTQRLKEALEEMLYSCYAHIEDIRPTDAYGIPYGSWNYGRGLRALDEEQPKPEPEVKWTEKEVSALQDKFRVVSRTSLEMQKVERRSKRSPDAED